MTSELRAYIESTTDLEPNLARAYEDAEEFGLDAPDVLTGQLLTTLVANARAQAAIAVTPALNVAGLYLLAGLTEYGILTCIDPEPEHQRLAKLIFREAGYPHTRIRFLPSRPLDVMGRLANKSYQIIYAEVAPMDITTLVDAALPLLSPGGSLVLPDVLFDGTLTDETRRDPDTRAIREADEYIRSLSGAHVCRLPLGTGMTIVTKMQ